MNAARPCWQAWLIALLAGMVSFTLAAQSTNGAASTNGASSQTESVPHPAPQKLDESAFRLITDRNIFNANRSGGTVRSTSRRVGVVESFALVGTMAYEKGVFAFFEGSSSEFTKVIKPHEVIAGYKLVEIQSNSVKLESAGKEIELPIGSQMRREDQGAWQVAEVVAGGNSSSSSQSSGRGGRSGRSESSAGSQPAAGASGPSGDQNEILKRLMERREKE